MKKWKTHMYVHVPEDKRSCCATSKHLRWREGDFTYVHLLTVFFWERWGRRKRESDLILTVRKTEYNISNHTLAYCGVLPAVAFCPLVSFLLTSEMLLLWEWGLGGGLAEAGGESAYTKYNKKQYSVKKFYLFYLYCISRISCFNSTLCILITQ